MAQNLKHRVETRLAWLGLSHQQLAEIIEMDPSSLSRALRADCPRKKTVRRIARGLGLPLEVLLGEEIESTGLLCGHPALKDASDVTESERMARLRRWVEAEDRHAD